MLLIGALTCEQACEREAGFYNNWASPCMYLTPPAGGWVEEFELDPVVGQFYW